MEYLKKCHQKSKQKAKPQHRNRSRSQPQKPNQRDDTQQFQSEQSHYISVEVVVRCLIKIEENNAQHGDISARSVTDIITMSQYVEKYQSFPNNKNTRL